MALTPLPNPKAARMALYAADAETLFSSIKDGDNPTGVPKLPGNPVTPPFTILSEANWAIAGQIRCDDELRVLQYLKRIFKLSPDNYFYGFLLQCTKACHDFAVGDYLAIVRGTMEPIEWVLDALALPALFNTSEHSNGGTVPDGFYSIYSSMTLVDRSGRSLGPAATAIGHIVNGENRRLTVVGHSLGAALVAYLTFDLAGEVIPVENLDAYMIACPNPGDDTFVKAFRNAVPNYNVVNWERDVVPKVPPAPYRSLLNGGPTQNVLVLTTTTTNIGPIPTDNPGDNHHAVNYARMLDKLVPIPVTIP